MTLDELIEEVYLITGRRDLIAETKSAVKAATLKAHKSDYYSKDLYETGVDLGSNSYKHSLDYISFISNFRALKYLRKSSGVDDDSGTFIEVVTPEEVLDAYQRNRNDIAYIAGRVLEIRSSTSFQYALFGCYVIPVVRDGEFASWVAEMHPYAIVYEAVRVIFRTVGNLEESRAYAQLAAEEYAELKMTGLADVGY